MKNPGFYIGIVLMQISFLLWVEHQWIFKSIISKVVTGEVTEGLVALAYLLLCGVTLLAGLVLIFKSTPRNVQPKQIFDEKPDNY